jgi:hypothetical protein
LAHLQEKRSDTLRFRYEVGAAVLQPVRSEGALPSGGETVARKKIIEAIEDKTAGEIAYGSLRLPGHEKQTI